MEHITQQATTTQSPHTARTTHTASRSRYVGPSAARIAELIAPKQRVRFERGWFWTQALCHDSEQEQTQDLLAFRQRPDGDGIDVRCKTRGCSRERIIRSLERLTGESIWSAYATAPRTSVSASAQSPADGNGGAGRSTSVVGRSWRLALAPVVVLLLAAPLVFDYGFEVVALNAFGLGWAGWLARRILLDCRRAIARGGRAR